MFKFRNGRNPLHLRVFMKDGDGDGGGGDDGKTWHEALPEDIRADPSLIDFKDETEMVSMPLNVARSYINTKKLVGRDKLPMPTNDEEWGTTYDRLGRPEAPSQYNIEVDPNIDPKLKEALAGEVDWFKDLAHFAGLNDVQSQIIFEGYSKKSGETFTGIAKGNEQMMMESEAELRTAYGNDFEGKMVLMNRGIDELDRRVGGKLKDLVQQSGISSNSSFVKSMVMVGEMMAEDLGLDKTTGGPATNAENLQDQIVAIQQSPAYLKADDPGHAVAVQKMAKLIQLKVGKEAVGPLTRDSFIT